MDSQTSGQGDRQPIVVDPPAIQYKLRTLTNYSCTVLVGEYEEEMIAAGADLMAYSLKFRHLLLEAGPTPLTVRDMKPETFKDMLRFMYGVQIVPALNLQQAVDLMCGAVTYEVEQLKIALAEHIAPQITVDNVYSLLERPECFKEPTLKTAIDQIIQISTKELLTMDQFLQLSPAAVLVIVRQKGLSVSEFELWTAVVRWAKHHAAGEKSELRELLVPILQYIRFCSMTNDDFINLFKEDILTKDEIFLIGKSIARKIVPEELKTVCNKIESRVLNFHSELIKLDLAAHEKDRKLLSSSYMNIVTKDHRLMLFTVTLKAQTHFLCCYEPNYRMSCKVTVTRITPFSNNTPTLVPRAIVCQFNEDVQRGSDIVLPLRVRGKNIVLLENSEYKLELELNPAHSSYVFKEKTDKIFNNEHLTLVCGSLEQQTGFVPIKFGIPNQFSYTPYSSQENNSASVFGKPIGGPVPSSQENNSKPVFGKPFGAPVPSSQENNSTPVFGNPFGGPVTSSQENNSAPVFGKPFGGSVPSSQENNSTPVFGKPFGGPVTSSQENNSKPVFGKPFGEPVASSQGSNSVSVFGEPFGAPLWNCTLNNSPSYYRCSSTVYGCHVKELTYKTILPQKGLKTVRVQNISSMSS